MRDFLTSPLGTAVWFLGGMLPFWLVLWWQHRRSRREAAERTRQWAVQEQVWEMERQIWDEMLSEEEREVQRQARERQRAIKAEARRRLGLPEEDPRG